MERECVVELFFSLRVWCRFKIFFVLRMKLNSLLFIDFIVLFDFGDELYRVREVWNISKICLCKEIDDDDEDNDDVMEIGFFNEELI